MQDEDPRSNEKNDIAKVQEDPGPDPDDNRTFYDDWEYTRPRHSHL